MVQEFKSDAVDEIKESNAREAIRAIVIMTFGYSSLLLLAYISSGENSGGVSALATLFNINSVTTIISEASSLWVAILISGFATIYSMHMGSKIDNRIWTMLDELYYCYESDDSSDKEEDKNSDDECRNKYSRNNG